MKKSKFVFVALLVLIALIGVSPVGAQEGDVSGTGCETYVVQANDWLSKIAEKFLGDMFA